MTLLGDTDLSGVKPVRRDSRRGRLSPARLGEIAAAVAAQPDNWSGLVRFDDGRRWYQRLELAHDHEVWLLSWLPGQGTGFHDHGAAAGAFAVAEGQVLERTVGAGSGQAAARGAAAGPALAAGRTAARGPVLPRHQAVHQGGVRSFGPRYVHDVVNASGDPAITVHAYSPPLTVMRRYELTESGLTHTATQHAEQDR